MSFLKERKERANLKINSGEDIQMAQLKQETVAPEKREMSKPAWAGPIRRAGNIENMNMETSSSEQVGVIKINRSHRRPEQMKCVSPIAAPTLAWAGPVVKIRQRSQIDIEDSS